jgi:putrescine:ornithine antiporter
MFSPAIGSIVMALAALACVGSLLGWQFTLAQTAKDASDMRMFPAIFSKTTASGAPVAGMVVMGVLQTVMALSTVSPNLSEQFAALVNLAVVTNVLPYVISLSALFVMMRGAKVDRPTWRRNGVVATIAMLYSVYVIYASGKDAVLGGMLVLALGYVVWGFIAPRFASVPAVVEENYDHPAAAAHAAYARG